MNSKDNMNTPQNKNTPVRPMRGLMWALYVIFGIAMIWIVRNYSGSDPVKTEWLTVKESMIPHGDVEKITYITNLHRAEVYIRKDSLSKYVNRSTSARTRSPSMSTVISEARPRRPDLISTS